MAQSNQNGCHRSLCQGLTNEWLNHGKIWGFLVKEPGQQGKGYLETQVSSCLLTTADSFQWFSLVLFYQWLWTYC